MVGRARLDRFLAAVLFTDIVGSTEHAEELGDRRWRQLLEQHNALVRAKLGEYRGREIDTAGDGFFAAFDAPALAVECALDVARSVEAALGLRIRAGVHVGEVEPVGQKLGGIAVHLGARLAASAEPGQVLVSRSVRDLVAGSGLRFRDLGRRQLKGVQEEWRVYEVIDEGIAVAHEERAARRAAAIRRAETAPFWRLHPRATALTAALLVLALSTAGLWAWSPWRPPALPGVGPNTAGLVDAGRGEIVGEIAVGVNPDGIAVDGDTIWVANTSAGTVSRIDASSMAVVDTLDAGQQPNGVTVGFGAVWVSDSGGRAVLRIDARTSRLVQEIPVGNAPTGIAVGSDAVWVSNTLDGTVSRIDPGPPAQPGSPIAVGASPRGIAVGEGRVWVANADEGSVTAIDEVTGAVVASVGVGNGPTSVLVAFGSVWVVNGVDSTVSRIDPESTSVIATIPVGLEPQGLAATADDVWVGGGIEGSVARIDPATNEVEQVATVSAPRALAAVGNDVWFTARGSAASHRGGTLEVVSEVLPSLDPATPAAATDIPFWGAMFDGLVAFKKVAGTEGGILVPGLAISLPEPIDAGQTYTFRLRPGLLYSDGRPVRPEDFRHAIERSFETPPTPDDAYGAFFLTGIAGASRCLEGLESGDLVDCDLSEGVVTESDSITFHLTDPDPEFLYKLALPFAAAVPGDTPADPLPLGATIASTGPYMVASVTETELLLVRNPHFSEWSRGAQPDGYPDEIRWTGGLDPDHQVDAILAGDADLMLTWPPTERIGELPTRMPGQYHPFFAGTAFAFFANPSEPPFDDERLRRAVNLAVDRRVITEILGGPLFARETCQAIPPNFHGYEPYCPYTLDPNPANRWTAPDRSAALALVREAGIPDTPIEVWTYHPVQHPFGAHIATVLRDLGFDATHQEVERDPFFNDLDAARTMDIGVIAWFAEYPAASNFVSALFSCAAFANFSDFCDPDLDARMADATDLQARDPAAAARLWAEVDRAITDFGLWIPLVNVGDSLHLVSTRVGNYQWHPAYGLLLSQLWVQ